MMAEPKDFPLLGGDGPVFVGTSVCGGYAPASGCQGLGQEGRAWDLCLVPRKLKGA